MLQAYQDVMVRTLWLRACQTLPYCRFSVLNHDKASPVQLVLAIMPQNAMNYA
jgi:hypothetical protein